MTFSKICIYGAGAIGGWIGARLAQRPGMMVSVVARGETLRQLQSHGLQLNSGDNILSAKVRASQLPTSLGIQDLVIVAVKAPSMLDVAKQIQPLIGPNTIVMTAMNGVPWWFLQGFGGVYANTPLKSVDPKGQIAAAIPPTHIIGCVVHASSSLRAPGQVQHHFGNGLIIGEPAGGSSARVQALHQLLRDAGFDATLSERIQKDVWYKLWGNMTINPISALTGATCDRILDDELVLAFVTRVMHEAAAIGAQIGCAVEQTPAERHLVTRKLGAFKTSMLQDLEAGRPLELAALVGAVREIGLHLGLPTPNTDAILGLTRLMAQTRSLAAPGAQKDFS